MKFPAWLRWFVTFHLVVFGWILFRSTEPRGGRRATSRACCEPGSATLFTVPVALMILVVIGLQLLPERGVERVQVRIERMQPVLLGAGLAVVIALVAATVSSPGRGALHLLPLLSHALRRLPDEPLRPQRAAAVPRARRRDRAAGLRGAAGGLQGRFAASARASGWTRAVTRDVVLLVGRAGGRRRRRAAVRATPTDDATAFLSPDEAARAATAAFATVAAGHGRRGPAGHRRTRSSRRRSASGRRRARPLKTLLVTGDSMVQPLDAKLADALADRGVKVERDAHLGHRHLQDVPGRLGRALDRAGARRSSPTRWSCSSAPTRASRWRARAGGGRVLRGRLGGAVRQPRATDGRHLPPERERARCTGSRSRRRGPANRAPITRVVNAAVRVAAQPWASQVRVIDTIPIFAPQRLSRFNVDRRAATASFAPLMGSTSMMQVRGCCRRPFWRAWERTSRTDGTAYVSTRRSSSLLVRVRRRPAGGRPGRDLHAAEVPGLGLLHVAEGRPRSAARPASRSRWRSTSAAPRRASRAAASSKVKGYSCRETRTDDLDRDQRPRHLHAQRLQEGHADVPAEHVIAALAALAVLFAGAADAAPRCYGAAVARRRQAVRERQARASVTPTPEEAAITPNVACTPRRPGRRRARRRRASGETVVLLGDSHAAHWRAGDGGRREAPRLARARVRPPALPVLVRGARADRGGRGGVRGLQPAVIAWLAAHPDVTTVFVSNNARLPMAERGHRLPARRRLARAARAAGVGHATCSCCATRRPTARRRTTASTARCGASARRARVRGAAQARARARSDGRVRAAARAHGRSTSRRSSARRGQCFPVVGGVLVHKDQDHLTQDFARTLGPYIDAGGGSAGYGGPMRSGVCHSGRRRRRG